jgi:DNA replication protein DnaC
MNQLESQFKELRLQGMNQCWQSLVETRKHHEISLAEGLELLLQAENQQRINNRFERLRKNARFRYQASIEEIQFSSDRKLDKSYILELATNQYINKGESILITGATGSGKSFIASAFGHHACVDGYKVLYFNTQKLFIKTKMARLDGTIYKLFEQLAKTDLMILDDFGLMHLEK